ncbi:hypothetical protein BCR33DRAFT_712307 [Rhizoclosmatium globosum]|uniref:THO complex subunit 1 transcription elongation factor-domain-containing protein n=1 Tax=Rhizoclosmatium globosum TaxID=329046 RepID=A0A1Y2CYJ6_9FUNG|nr:hypothetical protein BCR33DRAFT_712307 [Rhizoclosmatium globosum]|eukprot:ORY52100.1 hypothetical protein BCR33DRAFT_712307 [Rhizoclosmatium globosum]
MDQTAHLTSLFVAHAQQHATTTHASNAADNVTEGLALLRRSSEAAGREGVTAALKGACVALVTAHGDLAVDSLAALFDVAAVVGDAALVLLLVEDTAEMLTLRANLRLFEYIERKKVALTENLEPNKGKALTLLRYCNDLLRRVSKTQHSVFSCRILLFLTSVFALTERSGVNLKGDFNTDNTTILSEDDLNTETAMDVDSSLPAANDKRFYHTFWSLQRFFSDPLIVLKSPAEWSKMESAIEAVLAVFEAENDTDLKSGSDRKRKASAMNSASASSNDIGGGTADKELDLKDEYFFPKFLTSRNLFELQIKDISFRRQIMVQMLIIFQFFMGLTKHASEAAAGTTTNKALQFLNYTLTEAQESWVNQIRARVVRIVEQTGPNGRRFLTTLTTVVTHEANWIKWKSESCPSFEKRLNEKLETKKKFLEHSLAIKKDFTGSQELNVLKMVETDPKVLLEDTERRSAVVPLPTYLEPLAEQLNDDGTVAEGVEDEYLYSNDKCFNWRAYRTALASHFHLFRDVDNIDTKVLVKRLKMEEAGVSGGGEKEKEREKGEKEREAGKEEGAEVDGVTGS